MRCARLIAGLSLLVAGLLAGPSLRAQDAADRPEDRAAIKALNEGFAKAFNAGDAAALAALFAADARVADEDGPPTVGRAAVEKRFAGTFQDSPGAKIAVKSESLRFLTADVALEEGTVVVRQPGEDGEVAPTPYTVLYVKRDGKWLHADVRDRSASAPAGDEAADAPSQHLKALEWMVGEWVEEGQDAAMTSTCRWIQNNNFLMWEYQVKAEGAHASGGMSLIGWDPQTRQIKSWVFDAEGGHGEASWSRYDDNQWVVKAGGVLADGRAATATQYVKRLGPDRASWTSLDRAVSGEAAADISEYVLVRKPPRPADAPKPAGAPKPADAPK